MATTLEEIGRAYSSRVGIQAGDVKLYTTAIGSPYTSVQDKTIGRIGFTGVDLATPGANVQSASGTNPVTDAYPQVTAISEVTVTPISVEPRLFAAYAGFINSPGFIPGQVDIIDTATMQRDTENKGLNIQGVYDAWQGVTEKVNDIGQRMIPDAAQTFDTFAGGLRRKLKGIAPVAVVKWERGLQSKRLPTEREGDLVDLETYWNENILPWSATYDDVLSKGWNVGSPLGQGWNAFALGAPTKTSGELPVVQAPNKKILDRLLGRG